MLLEPLGQGRCGAIREERHGLAALQIDQDGAIGVPFPEGEVVHTSTVGGGDDGVDCNRPWEQGVAAHREVPGVAEAHPSRPAERHAEGDKAPGEPQGAPCPGGGWWAAVR